MNVGIKEGSDGALVGFFEGDFVGDFEGRLVEKEGNVEGIVLEHLEGFAEGTVDGFSDK